MKRFNYMFNHKKDEAYMKKMCDQGWTTKSLADEGIEYVSRYSFWTIFRSEHDFELYKGKEELKIRRPMPYGAIMSVIICVWLIVKANVLFKILGNLFL